MVTLIVAFDENRVIGYQNSIPWKIPEDMNLFKKTTTGHAVIMGRNTWDSLPRKFKPLPDRTNIVVSGFYKNNPEEFVKTGPDNRTYITSNLTDAIELAKVAHKEVFIIGGAQIYKTALEQGVVDRMLISQIRGTYLGDTYFPKISDDWTCFAETKYDKFDLLEYRLTGGRSKA